MVPDCIALVVNTFGQAGKVVGLNPDQEKCGCGVLPLQYVEDFRCPLGIGAIVKRERDLVGL